MPDAEVADAAVIVVAVLGGVRPPAASVVDIAFRFHPLCEA